MSLIICRICNSKIVEPATDPEHHLILCPTCGGIEFSSGSQEIAPYRSSNRGRPGKIWLRAGDDTLMIIHRRFAIGNFLILSIISFLLIFALFYSEQPLFMVVINPLTLIIFAIGLGFFIKVVSWTIVRVTPTQLAIRYGPFALQKKVINADDIRQLYVKAQVSGSGKNKSTSYNLFLRDRHNKDKKLVGLETPEQAQFFEQEIERYLRIKDQPIKAELETSLADTFKEWAKFAAANNLYYQAGKLQEGHRVVGDYHGYVVDLLITTRYRLLHRTTMTLTLTDRVERSKNLENPLEPAAIKRLFSIPFLSTMMNMQQFAVEDSEQRFVYEQYELETDREHLQFILTTLYNLAEVYPRLKSYGGEIIPLLHPAASNKQHAAQPIALDLVEAIAASTKQIHDQEGDALLCSHCLLRWAIHKAEISKLTTVTYYSCPQCHRSQEYFVVDRVVAALDNQAGAEPVEQGRTLTVNWLAQQSLFDFDAVEIVQATDEEVERFVVQVGNDTDPIRQPHYADMACVISPDCNLSDNTWRILERTFGQVEIKSLVLARK